MKQYITALALFACVSFCSAMDKRQKIERSVAISLLKQGRPEKALETVPIEHLMPLLSEEMLKKLPANSLGELCHHICNAKLQKKFPGPLEAVIKKYVQNVLKSHKSIGLFYDKNTKTQKAIADVTALNESLKSLQAVVELEIETDNGLSYWQSPVGQAIRISNRKYEVALLTMMTDLLQMINSVQQLCLAKTCLKEIEKIPNIPPFLKQVNRAKYLSYKEGLLRAQNKEHMQEKIKKQNAKIKTIITAIDEGSIKSKKGFLYPYFESLLDYVTLLYQTTQSLSPKQEEFYAKLINQSTNPATAIRASLNYLTILIDTHPDFVKKPQIYKNIHKCINHLRNIKDPGLNNKAAGICAWALAKEYEQTAQAKKLELKAQIEQLLEKYERASGQNIPALSSLGQQSLDIFLSRIGDAYSKIGKNPEKIDNESQFVYCMKESEKCFYSDPKKSFKLATLASEIAPTPQKKAHAALLLATLCLAKEDIKAAYKYLEENENLIAQGRLSDESRKKLQAQTTFTRGCVLLFRDVAAACEQFEKALAIANPYQTVQTLSFYIPGLCMMRDFGRIENLLQTAQQNKERNGSQELQEAEVGFNTAQWLAWGLTHKNEQEAKKWLQKAAQQDKNLFIQQLARMYRANKILVKAAESPVEESLKLQKKSLTLLEELINDKNYNPWAFAQAQSMYGLLYLRLEHGITEITDETIEEIKNSKALPHLKDADSQTVNKMARAEVQPVLCALAQDKNERTDRIVWTALQQQNWPKKCWAYDQLACTHLRGGNVTAAAEIFTWLAHQNDPDWQKCSQEWLKNYQQLLDYGQ